MKALFSYVFSTMAGLCLIGGILLSAALLFGGLAVTVVTIKNEEDYYEQN